MLVSGRVSRALALAIAFLMLLWTLYQLRLRQLKYQFSRTLETRVDERTRIARDLHDHAPFITLRADAST